MIAPLAHETRRRRGCAAAPARPVFRGLGHVARLVGIALILARHDALFLFEPIGAAPLLRAARVVRRRGNAARPGERLACRVSPDRPGVYQARPDAGDPRRPAGGADRGGFGVAAGPPAAISGRRGARADRGRVRLPARNAVPGLLDDTPVAAASIAQVHFATTSEGDEVAVKVLRPGIARAFARDLDLLLWLARLIERTQTTGVSAG